MLAAVRNAFTLPDLRRKLLFTLFILIVYRFAAHIPVPGVDLPKLRDVFANSQFLGFLNLLSGGALRNFSILAMGVYPYITATIIFQLLTPLVPALKELTEEGEAGRQKLTQYQYWLTIPLAALQGYAQAVLLQQSGALPNFGFFSAPLVTLTIVVSLVAGTMFAMWLGQLITEDGIGNGISIIIFGGIIAAIPSQFGTLYTTSGIFRVLLLMLLTLAMIAAIVVIQEAQRRIPVQYGKRVRGTKMYGGQSTYVPLRVNSAGMIPLIFASSILILPGLLAQGFIASPNEMVSSIAQTIYRVFNTTSTTYWIMYFILVVAFTFFYADTLFRQQNLPENLQRQGGFIPGIRPGKRTEEYLDYVLNRITLAGAVFLGVIAIMPWLVSLLPGFGVAARSSDLLVTSSGLLIVVGVTLDTMKQLEAQLLMRHYEGFIK
ncbi:MAG: preprotein translocase subunit SecY [Anaerolineae bacterium]